MSTGKRTGYLSWDEYFMSVAFLAAKRSKDPITQVGACIVDKRKVVVGLGYNGMPTGCSDDEFPWGKDADSKFDNKTFYVCHAELNAILNKNCTNLEGCSIYVGLFPCNECAKCIIQSGIREVVYLSDKHAKKLETQASKRMLEAAGVECSDCAKLIIQSGIREVVYLSDKHAKPKTKASKRMLEAAGVQVKQFDPKNQTTVIINCFEEDIVGRLHRKRPRKNQKTKEISLIQ